MLVFAGALVAPVIAAAQEDAGRVLAAAGDVVIVRGDQRIPAQAGTPVRAGSWPVRAEGDGRLESVTLHPGPRRVGCDHLACGFGLVPNTELGSLFDCRVDSSGVAIDRWQQTSQPGIYAAGEVTGIAGVDAALVEGQIAGYAATDQRAKAESLFAARDRSLGFRRAMEWAFALRPELATLADADTVVCRCEGVTLGQLQDGRSWRSAKLQTRCGMGPCQGRVCGPAVAHLLGWPPSTVRPPLFPTAAANLAGLAEGRGTGG